MINANVREFEHEDVAWRHQPQHRPERFRDVAARFSSDSHKLESSGAISCRLALTAAAANAMSKLIDHANRDNGSGRRGEED